MSPSDPTPLPSVALQAPTVSDLADLPVRFDAIGKRYRAHQALRGVSFEVGAGQSVAIAGVNGAGKTTLLRCLLGFAAPDQGEVRIFGVRSDQAQARARLAWLPERFNPPAHLSGAETLQMLAGLGAVNYSRARALQVLERLEFPTDAIDRPIRSYSKGMNQKMGLAAVLMSDKPLWVLDEPMSGLDPLARRCVLNALQQARQSGVTLLFTSHAMADIERLCDRVVVIHQGSLRFTGKPEELCQRHQVCKLEDAFLQCIDQSTAHQHRIAA